MATGNNALMNTGEFIALQDNDFISFEYRPRSRIARLYGNSIFNFLKNFQIHIIFHYDCTNWHTYQLCPRVLFSLHLCQYLLSFNFLIIVILKVWGDISLWFWFVVLQWLVMLSIFSYIYWPFVYLLWKNIHSDPLLIFNWVVHFHCYWVVPVPYIFWTLTYYQLYDLQI